MPAPDGVDGLGVSPAEPFGDLGGAHKVVHVDLPPHVAKTTADELTTSVDTSMVYGRSQPTETQEGQMPADPNTQGVMTMTTEVPSWLNLDVLVGPELRAEIAEVRSEADSLEPGIRDFVVRAYRTMSRFEAALTGHSLPDDTWSLIRDVCGASAAFESLARLTEHLEIAALELPINDGPEWYQREVARTNETAAAQNHDAAALKRMVAAVASTPTEHLAHRTSSLG